VYILEVSGSEAAIAEFEKWCHKGSPGSKVEQVKSQQIPEKQFSGFDIRYGNN
jgi:acylphosphatase